MSLKIDDQSLTDGTCRSGHYCQSTQPPPQQPPPPRRPLQNFQYEDLSNEKELNNPFYQENDFEDEAYDGGLVYKRGYSRMANPNPNKREGFLFPNHVRRRDYSIPNEYRMTIEISSVSGNLEIELLDWIYEVEIFLIWCMSLRRSMSSS